MRGCGQKKFHCEILSELSQLQDLIIEEYWDGMFAPITVKEKVECLRKLETLECHFEVHSDSVGFLKSRDRTQELSTYKFFVGQWKDNDYHNSRITLKNWLFIIVMM
jgi:disease resistance protein RPS2